MRLSLTIAVASLLVGGCTRDNPAFGLNQTGSGTLGPEGDGDGDEGTSSESTASDTGAESTSSGDAEGGDGDGDDGSQPPVELPPCSEGTDWLRIPILEDNFVYYGATDKLGCLLDPGDIDGGGVLPPVYGPTSVPCSELNLGKVPEFFLNTGQAGRTGLLARLDIVNFTGRGINAYSAHYKFAVPFSSVDGEAILSLAPLRDDQGDWHAGGGYGDPYTQGESTFVFRSAPDTWDGESAFSVVDLTKLLTAQWLAGDDKVEIEVPYGRVQAWLDEEGRADPGFVVWSDVVEPFAFYMSANEGVAGGELWVEACLDDA